MTVVTNNRFFTSMACILGALLVLCPGFARSAAAAPRIDVDAPASLEVEATYDRTPLSGMTFNLYRVGTIDAKGACMLLEAYTQSDTDVSALTATDTKAEDLRELASSLGRWTQDRGLPADATATTDASGHADFGTLEAGFYLLQGSSLSRDADTFTSASALVSLPQYDVESDAWNYAVSVQPKVAKKTDATSGERSEKKSADTSNEASAQTGLLSVLRRMGLVATGDDMLTPAGIVALVAAGTVLCFAGLRFMAKANKREQKN